MDLKQTRWTIAILGIVVPYLARIPGIFTHGSAWLTSYFGDSPMSFLFFGAFNAICWGAALLATIGYRHVSSCWYPAAGALASSAWLHSTVDLSADAQSALALIVIPFLTLPFTSTGWIVGWMVDRRKPVPDQVGQDSQMDA